MKGFWRRRGRAAKMDLYLRVTLYVMPWITSVGALAPFPDNLVRNSGSLVLVQGLMAVLFVQCVLLMHCLNRGLAHRLHGAPAPWRSALVSVALGAVVVTSALTLQATGGLAARNDNGSALSMLLFYGLIPTMMSVYALSRVRWLILGTAVAAAVVGSAAGLATGRPEPAAVTVVSVLLAGVFCLITYRSSLWYMAMIWELDRARDTAARLAVAEERLRFGRDLHDVMGRNLAVIALKSELAMQLARRGRPEAAEQMAEVQRIAQESQREVREVVRGYREADLRNEIEGARGVLAAAGITCTVADAPAAGLPAGVQSALGWVVRETTTNVLRHGNPKSCALRLTSDGVGAVLVVENDGATAGATVGATGSGLAGLRERLAAVGGTLAAGATGDGMFRVTAVVPLSAPDEPAPPDGGKTGHMSPQHAQPPAPATGAKFLKLPGRPKAGAA
ncbi:sensor histidine kinase [Streptomyces candidus]|uniref:Two-component system sensor histidine kinase DesK n=1 Tax=Streptomyces candidus TaxID=67283 RepID=A0A7X0HJ73_9ACTN|nr:sensor histidine kinase [Streptomyces candidus]MBB6437153.1 two-component system sensor histidine kinase DesK [Streptomyces candidus]GHH38015.1 histidine kinase [Streptomyces candidus]